MRRDIPKGCRKPIVRVKKTLERFGFTWVQGSVYVCEREDLANLFAALQALKSLQWFTGCVRDIRSFRIEQWSDFTNFFKS